MQYTPLTNNIGSFLTPQCFLCATARGAVQTHLRFVWISKENTDSSGPIPLQITT